MRYFDVKLRWRPWAFQRLVDWPDAGHEFTVPETNPEWFDTTYRVTQESATVIPLNKKPVRCVPERLPGRRANVFVPADNSQYAEMMERAQTGDEAEFRHDMSGIWVAESWLKPAGYLGTR